MFSSLFLSFFILAAGTSVEQDQQQEHKPCRQPQTGSVSFPSILYVFFRGVDLTRLDISSLDEGTTLTLFNLTCDRGTRWADGSVEYLIPDQIERISTLAESTERLSTPVTCFQLGCYRRKVLTANVDLDSDLRPVNGRGVMVESAEYRMEVKNDLLGNHWVFGEIHSDRLKFSVTMATAEDLRPSCFLPERLLKLLEDAGGGGDYASNPTPYQEALRLYGTHYFASGTFGARTVELTRLRPDYYFAARAASLGNLTDNVRAHFEQRFDRLDPAYAQNVHVERSWFGRFPPPTPDQAPGAYWPLAVSLKPITELLEQGHPAKAQLAVAIRVRLMRAALRDWSRSLQKMNDLGGSNGWGLLMGAFQPGGLLERVNEQLAETVPEEAAVERIGALVETMEDFIGLMNDHTPKG